MFFSRTGILDPVSISLIR